MKDEDVKEEALRANGPVDQDDKLVKPDRYFLDTTTEELSDIVMDILTGSRYQRAMTILPNLEVTFKTLVGKEQSALYKEMEKIEAGNTVGMLQDRSIMMVASQAVKIGEATKITTEYIQDLPQPVIVAITSWLQVFNNLVTMACETTDLGN